MKNCTICLGDCNLHDNLGLPLIKGQQEVTTRIDEHGQTWKTWHRHHEGMSNLEQMGVFGNVWVYGHHLKKAGDYNAGHKHHFDHITMLAQGSVRCTVKDEAGVLTTREFKAPTFIVIDKNKEHTLVALEDDTVFYCVFALRDKDGDVTDFYSGDNSPYMSRFD